MRLLIYYSLFPFLYLTSISPTWILYRISDFLFLLVYYIVGYRKKIVFSNLQIAFPHKTPIEIKQIAKKYYQYLCDLLVEVVKTINMSEGYVQKHLTFNDVEKINAIFDKRQSIIIVMGHLGNWEMAGPCFSLNCKHQLKVVYQVLSNPYFEKLLVKSRTKFSTKIIPRKKMLKSMVADKDILDATAIIADQAPTDLKSGYWLKLFERDTLVHIGPEKISKMFNYPIVYIHVERVKRGYYEITPTILFEEPQQANDFEITTAFFNQLEKDIKKQPETWLWSHRRWKHQLQ